MIGLASACGGPGVASWRGYMWNSLQWWLSSWRVWVITCAGRLFMHVSRACLPDQYWPHAGTPNLASKQFEKVNNFLSQPFPVITNRTFRIHSYDLKKKKNVYAFLSRNHSHVWTREFTLMLTCEGFPSAWREGALRSVNYIIMVRMNLHLLGHYSCPILGWPTLRFRIRHTRAKWPC